MQNNKKRMLYFIAAITMLFWMADGSRWELQGTSVKVQAAEADAGSFLMEDGGLAGNAEGAVLVNGEEVYEGYVDVSNRVVQEGGYQSEVYAKEEAVMYSSEEENRREEQIQEALTEAWDSASDTCDLSSYQMTWEELKEIYSETLNKYPRYFYVSGRYSYYSARGFVSKVLIVYNMDKAEALELQEDYDAVVSRVKSNADEAWSDMEKALYIHDYLARNCAYDTSYSKYTAYDALVSQTAVCQGYALAFRELAQQLGLSCEIVRSDSLNHAWNLVGIDGVYYHVDVTWDDPIPDRIGRVRHQYFMKSTDYFKSEEGRHFKSRDWEITGGILERAASETGYDGYFWNSVDTGFDYLHGAWYGFDGEDSINRYACSGTDFQFVEDIAVIRDTWYVLDGSGYYWRNKYVGTGALNGKLYYSGKSSIYELDVESKVSTPVFTLTDEQQQSENLYGMKVTASGEIQYNLAEGPDVSENIHTLAAYQIVFDGNGADNESRNRMFLFVPGRQYPLLGNSFERVGHIFRGWNTEQDGSGTAYEDGSGICYQEGDEELTLYAQWEKQRYTISFDSQGGSSVSDQQIEYQGRVMEPEEPVREACMFGGWYTEPYCNTAYDFKQAVTGSMTLYAKWIPDSIADQEKHKPGDVNGDESIDASDALMVLKMAAGLLTLSDEEEMAADVSGDGEITSADALLILKYSAGLISEFQ